MFVKIIISLLFWLLPLNGVAQILSKSANSRARLYLDASRSPQERAADLLKVLTWEEKVGQMGGVRRAFAAGASFNRTSYDMLHATQNGILGFGSHFNSPTTILSIVNELRQEQINSSKVPWITVTDSVNGPYLMGGTVFPSSLTLASSFNIPLYGDVVSAIRDENMALGTHWVLGPTLDIAKEPRYGRVGETYGEDSYLVGAFGTKFVQTMQEKDTNGYIKVACTVKHFVYAQPNGGVNTASQFGGLNYLFNDLMPPFIRAIREANPISVMISYATIDRVPMSINTYMLQTILRGALGFTGVIMSDAGSFTNLVTHSGTASTPKAAGLKALAAGMQLELSPSQPATFPTLITDPETRNDPKVIALVDEAVTKLLEVKFATGMFDLPLPTLNNLNTTFRAPAHLDTNRKISQESIVLLSNQNHTLPLKTGATKIAVLGPFATAVNAGSYAASLSTDGKALLSSLEAEFGSKNVLFERGVDFVDNSNSTGIVTAVQAAKKAGLAIVTVGSLSVASEDPLASKRTDGEFFSHADISFPGLQQDLLDAVLDAGIPTIVVISGGQAFPLHNSTIQRAGAILHTFLGGEYTSDGVVEIITGKVNPSGKLPVSIPQYAGAIPTYYNYLPSDAGDASGWTYPTLSRDSPMPFGFGLSYTTFNFSDPVASSGNGICNVSVKVSNTGSVKGKEVVQAYFRQKVSTIETPVKQLIRFEKIELEPGREQSVVFNISESELGFYDFGTWTVESGNYTIFVGSSSKKADLKSIDIVVS